VIAFEFACYENAIINTSEMADSSQYMGRILLNTLNKGGTQYQNELLLHPHLLNIKY
jgi:hypothetical protein